jgi:hypothetical protein
VEEPDACPPGGLREDRGKIEENAKLLIAGERSNSSGGGDKYLKTSGGRSEWVGGHVYKRQQQNI